ncbi:hypothetical protein WA588_000024 [Blastocystis sp. NMH]
MQPNTKYRIVLGDSIREKDKEKLLLRYAFVPKSLNRERKAAVQFDNASDTVHLSYFDNFTENGIKNLSGVKRAASTNEFILVLKDDTLVLERVGGSVNHIKTDA